MEIYTDASFNTVGDGNSQIGFTISMKDLIEHTCPLLWKSKVARSTAKAEVLSLGEAIENGMYLKSYGKKLQMRK